MPERLSFGNIELNVSGKRSMSRGKPSDDTPFRILILGDFSGSESRGLTKPLGKMRPTTVDIDNIENVLLRLKPTIELNLGDGTPCPLSFESFDDFHPDHLLERVPLFQKLRDTRKALGDPVKARTAAAEVASWAGAKAPETATPPTAEPDEDTFSRLLGSTPGELPRRASAAAGGIQDLIRQVVAPYVVASPDPNVATMTAAVDAALGAQMNTVLHAPAFQALEASWRGIDFLVRNLDTDETLQIFLLDLSKAELTADLRGVENLADCAIFKTLVEETVQSPGGVPWAVIIGNYRFNTGSDDADLLARMAKIAAAAGAPFLAGAASEFVNAATSGELTADDAWKELQGLNEVSSIGLAAPGILLRLPYGRDTEPTERFDFEEMPEGPKETAYLWGNPALVCAYLLGESFRENGWEMSPGDFTELSGLPVHTFQVDDEKKMTPCAERWLTERHADALLRQGIMPILSIRGRDAVRLVRFQSIAEPPIALAGRWS